MIKRGILLFMLAVFVIAIVGCSTVKGACEGAFEGAKLDWQAAQKIDGWMRENLW